MDRLDYTLPNNLSKLNGFPLLFIICAEIFSTLLIKADTEGKIYGVKIRGTGNDRRISHVLLANDSFVFCRANRTHNLKDTMDIIRQVLGQREKLPNILLDKEIGAGMLAHCSIPCL